MESPALTGYGEEPQTTYGQQIACKELGGNKNIHGGGTVKRRQEERILLSALERYGLKITPKLEQTVKDGLREIRRTKYEERMEAKKWKSITR